MQDSIFARRRAADEARETERAQIDELLRAAQRVIFAADEWTDDLLRLADAASALTGSDYGQTAARLPGVSRTTAGF